ncbi:MAG: GNAT family N-acetyltransferase [Herpetosiphonaceae bacterium]|nr:GNAT family N-acetyltransferase [Herpetosiphonaceae bacterium]
MTPAFLEACLANNLQTAEALLEITIPPAWLDERDLMQLRLEQVRVEPAYAPWMLRAMRLRETGQMVGHIGFHTQPGAEYLRALAPDGVEFGYTVFPQFRRHHYAHEASVALMRWTQTTYGVNRFVVSVRPDNVPSLGLIHNLGFQKIGSQIDEEDGPEDIFSLYCS